MNLVFKKLNSGKLELIKQDEQLSTYFGKRTPEDGRINWNWQKHRISNWIRAQAYPYPGAFSYVNNQKLIIDKVDDYIFDETLILIAEDGANLLTRTKPLAFMAEGKYWVNNHAHILC